jgi:hypothetical protein
MTSSSDLASSSLKDLLKICRSHALQLPSQLPEDKQYYVDLILRHRQVMRDAAASEESGSVVDAGEGSMSEGYVRVNSASALSALEGKEGEEAAGAALMHDIEYDDEEEDFARSPAVQKITEILQNIGERSGDACVIRAGTNLAVLTLLLSSLSLCVCVRASAVFDYLEHQTSIPRFYWLVVIVLTLSISIFLWIGPLAVWCVDNARHRGRPHGMRRFSYALSLHDRVHSIILVSNFICFVYPAYRTFKTLEGKFLPEQQFEGIEENQSIEVHRFW